MNNTETKVIEQMCEVFRNKDQEPAALTPETLVDGSLGLESLDFAELAIRLERVFGRDPFARGTIPSIRTIADLAKLYD